MFDEIKYTHGYGECSVVDCWQRVQDKKEMDNKKPMCYCHAKMRDGLIGDQKSYSSSPNTEWRYDNWDLTTE